MISAELIATGAVALVQAVLTASRRLEVRRERERQERRRQEAAQRHREREELEHWRSAIDKNLEYLGRQVTDIPSDIFGRVQGRVGELELSLVRRLIRVEELVTRFDERIAALRETHQRYERQFAELFRRLERANGSGVSGGGPPDK